MIKRISAITIVLVVGIAHSIAYSEEEQWRPIVSMVQLLSAPDKYDKKRLMIIGYFKMGAEDNAIYLSKEHADNWLLNSRIWINVPAGESGKYQEFVNGYVLVDGEFTMNPERNGQYAPGSISIVKMGRWPPSTDLIPNKEKSQSPPKEAPLK